LKVKQKLLISLIAAALLASAANASPIEVRPLSNNDVIIENGSADCIALAFGERLCR
jgi:hypothetical protein